MNINNLLNVSNQPQKNINREDAPSFLSRGATTEQRTRHYIENRWHDQYMYYITKAETNRKQHQRVQMFIAVVAVLVPVLLGFNGGIINWLRSVETSGMLFGISIEWAVNTGNIRWWIEGINAVPAVLSGMVAAAAALENVAKYGDNWRAFQSAADGMERERALFEANAGPYRTAKNPYRLFVERSEDVISQETGRYFAREDTKGKDDSEGEAKEIIQELMGDVDDDLTDAYESSFANSVG